MVAWTLRDAAEVLVIPVGLAVLALAWPSWQAFRRRSRFQQLVYEELLECMPSGIHDAWHSYLRKEFVHRRMIDGAADASEFVLSLHPRFTYELNQMWSSYQQAQHADRADEEAAVAEAGASWCFSLRAVCMELERHQRWRWRRRAERHRRLNELYRSWVSTIAEKHPATRESLAKLSQELG